MKAVVAVVLGKIVMFDKNRRGAVVAVAMVFMPMQDLSASATDKLSVPQTLSTVIVNGVPVPEQMVAREIERIAPVGSFHNLSAESLRKIRQKAINNIIDEELFYREALKRGLVWDEYWVEETFNKTRLRYKRDKALFDSMNEKKVKARLMDELRRGYVISSLLREEKDGIKVSEQEVRQYYDENRDSYKTPLAMKVDELLLQLEASSSKDDWDRSLKEAKLIHEKLKKGVLPNDITVTDPDKQPFKLIVQEKRIHTGIEKNDLAGVFKLKQGEISKPLFTLNGYILVKVKQVTEPAYFEFARVKDKVREDLLNQTYNNRILSLRDQLKDKANIIIGADEDNISR